RTILDTEEDFEVVADAESAEDIVELVWQTRPDVLLLDIRMPQGSGLDAVPAVLKISPNTQVLVLTASDDKEDHVRAFRLGAKGVILKDSARQTLMQAIRTVCRGDVWMDPRMSGALAEELSHMGDGEPISTRQENGLTDRELEIVRLVASGYKNRRGGRRGGGGSRSRPGRRTASRIASSRSCAWWPPATRTRRSGRRSRSASE